MRITVKETPAAPFESELKEIRVQIETVYHVRARHLLAAEECERNALALDHKLSRLCATPKKTYVLELTEREAAVLRVATGRIHGNPSGPRGVFDELAVRFEDLGVSVRRELFEEPWSQGQECIRFCRDWPEDLK